MNWVQWTVVVSILVLVVLGCIIGVHFLGPWLYIHFGVKGFGPYYGFWSGAGSDIAEAMIPVSFAIGLATWYRKNNCETDTCPRLGRHDTAAGHTVCRKHHPDDKLTHADILEAHENSLRPRE